MIEVHGGSCDVDSKKAGARKMNTSADSAPQTDKAEHSERQRMREAAGTDQPVMGYTEAARFLGLSARTLERYVREGRIPYVPLPKRGTWSGVRFLRHQLLQWLERRSVKPARANRITS
jgi:excisionase family DNA binding protein